MGWITDILKDLPLNAVLREKVLEADRQIENLQSENKRLIAENTVLKQKLARPKEPCPKGGAQEFNMTASRKHPIFGDAGVVERTHTCEQCGFTETREVDTFIKA